MFHRTPMTHRRSPLLVGEEDGVEGRDEERDADEQAGLREEERPAEERVREADDERHEREQHARRVDAHAHAQQDHGRSVGAARGEVAMTSKGADAGRSRDSRALANER